MKLLVTGATGFLGGWMCKKLIKEGHEVSILRRENSDCSEIQSLNLQHHMGDITDIDSLEKACEGIDSIFHLAGIVAYTKTQRALMEKVNVQGTQNVVDVCLKKKIRRLVHLSSVVAVGASFDPTPLDESSQYTLENFDFGYFETKRAGEEIVKKAVIENGLNAVILNPSTIYGAGDAKKGSRNVQLKVAQGKFNYFPTGGVNVVSIHDVVDGIYSGWENGKSGERYILSGDNLTVKELFSIIAREAGELPPSIPLYKPILLLIGQVGSLMEKFGKKGPINAENARISTLFHWFNCDKARRELGFTPRPAKVAIEESVAWIKEQKMI